MSWITAVIGLLEKIPPAFWGIVVGSFFSLGGVILTNRANDRRLRAQFTHDRELRIKDRELALRKEVYLAAAEAISAGFASVGKFADLNIPDNKVTEGYLDKAPAIAKVQIIANEETAKAVASVSTELSAVYLQLFAKRVPLNIQKGRLAQLDEQVASFGKERDRMIELMKQYNLEGAADQRRWNTIEGNFNFEQKRIAETLAQRGGVALALQAGQLEIAKECVDEITRLNQLVVPAIVAVRSELDIPIDEASYLQMVQDLNSKQKASMAAFLDQIRTLTGAGPNVAAAVDQKHPAS